jgi:hypothetical protein
VEVAARVGLDPRDAAVRLVNLAATGLTLRVTVEADPVQLQAALAYQYPAQQQPQFTQSQPYPQQYQQVPPNPYQQQGYPQPGPQGQGPSGRYPMPPQPSQAMPAPQAPPAPAQAAPVPNPNIVRTPGGSLDAVGTWGPAQAATWARGDKPPARENSASVATSLVAPVKPRAGQEGDTLHTTGLGGQDLSIALLEVVDPADMIFSAAGYTLQDGERAIVVHTEITNHGPVSYDLLGDLYLYLVAADGTELSKAPLTLQSRPPHQIGIATAATSGGHTVYVVDDAVEITRVKWLPSPDNPSEAVTWSLG